MIKIESFYDKVWCMINDKPQSMFVYSIENNFNKSDTKYVLLSDDNTAIIVDSKNVFNTKEELLKSLL